MYQFRGFYVPERMMEGIRKYVEEGVVPGDFLTGIIENDLKKACYHADDENLKNIPAFVAYFYNRTPSTCWGSKAAMDAWVEVRSKATMDALVTSAFLASLK